MAIERKKVGIIGTGNVGATLAFYLVTEHLCDDLVLIDRNEKKALAEMLDLQHSMGYSGNNISVTTGTYADCGSLDVIVLAISAPYIVVQLSRQKHLAFLMNPLLVDKWRGEEGAPSSPLIYQAALAASRSIAGRYRDAGVS